MKLFISAIMLMGAVASAKEPGVIKVYGQLVKVENTATHIPCEGGHYAYQISGTYKYKTVLKNFGPLCFDSVAVPLIGAEDHGGSLSGNLLTDIDMALERNVGHLIYMSISVYDMEKLEGGLQTLLSLSNYK